MKRKGIFSLTAISFAMVLGAVGALRFGGGEAIKEANAAPTSVKIAGSFTNWESNPIDMTLNGDYYTYKRAFSVNEQFKVIVDGTWIGASDEGVSKPAGIGESGGNFNVTTADTYVVRAVHNIDTYGKKGYGVSVIKYVAPTSYSLTGDFNSWADLDMNLADGVATYSNLSLTEGQELKIRADHSWDTSFGYSYLDNASKAYFTEGGSGNMAAAGDGLYSFSLNTSTSAITVTFTPAEPSYAVSVAGGSPIELVKGDSFIYDTDKTGWNYTATITATANQLLTFTRNSVAIQPGASGATNNLRYNTSTKALNVEQNATSQLLTLKVYQSGYDALFAGYTPTNQTYYFTNNQDWDDVFLYAFKDNYRNNATWPGVELTTPIDIDKDDNERYSFTLDTGKYDKIVLNNNDGDQSVDIVLAEKTQNGIYLSTKDGEDKYTVGEYPYAAVVKSLKVNNVTVALSPSSTDDPAIARQWETATLSLTAGQSIKYMVDDVEKTASLQAYGLNNGKVVEGEKQVLVNASAKIYVKEMAAGGVQIFVMGINELSKGYHILLNENEIVELVDSGETPDGFTGQTMSEDITFHKNDSFRLINTNLDDSLPVPFSPARFDEFSAAGFALSAGKIVYSGNDDFEAAVYLKLKSGDDMVYVGATNPNAAAAKAFAIEFNNAIDAVCELDGSTDQSDLEDAWAIEAANFAALTEAVQTKVKEGKSSSIEEIRTFETKYEFVYKLRKLGSGWDLDNFLERNYSPSPITNPVTQNNNMVLVVLFATIGVIGATALFFVLRKKESK